MSDISIKNLRKSFGDKIVFSDLNLEIKGGSVTCIKGQSGYGKTTLIKMLAGLETVDGGEITGVPQAVGFVFQEDRLCEDFSAVSNIRLVLGKGHDEMIKTHLTELGLGEYLSKPVREFSGGMKRRVAIARAICAEPELLLLDEPFKGLDEALREEVISYVLKHMERKTIICVTHDPKEAALMGGTLIDMEAL